MIAGEIHMSDSSVKTWFARHGFKPAGFRSNSRNWFSHSRRVCRRAGRFFRIRKTDGQWVVDISDLEFDRWANSTEKTVTLHEFMHEIA